MSAPARDASVANERTALAWQRSALALLAVDALMLHLTLDGRIRAPELGVAAAIGAAALWAELHGHRVYRARTAGMGPSQRSTSRALSALSLVTLLAAAAGIAELLGSTL